MRIKGFPKFVGECLEPYILNDSTVVIDGHNLFYSMYRASGLQFVLGPESDLFASYIKDYFEMFKKANVNCLILIKGGHENEETLDVHYDRKSLLRGKDFKLGHDYGNIIINPILAKDIFLQTLDEMGFKYSICCKNDIVEECSTLARELSCPVISYNIQYCFSAVKYIPLPPGKKIHCDKNNKLKCGMFARDKFLNDYKITMEKMILFILLTDTHLFDENTFTDFMNSIRLKMTFFINYKRLLQWLYLNSEDQALSKIFKHISEADKLKFLEKKLILNKKLLTKNDAESMAVIYFINENHVQIGEFDPLWFEKGVCLHHIHISYIDLYYYKTIQGSHLIEDYKADNSTLLAIDIIKYAYDLLTNFKGDKIIFYEQEDSSQSQNSSRTYELSIRKPEYDADSSVFENGWDNVKSLFLFEHFLIETFQSFNFDALDRAPADSRMLLIAMVYFSRKKIEDVTSEIYSIMLSYVMFSIVGEKVNIRNVVNASRITEQPTLDPTTDKKLISVQDCEVAASIMGKYFDVSDSELHDIFDPVTIHPLVEFQRCLKELNCLNTLCGSSFDPTVYSKTYNGTFVYKVLCDIKQSDGKQFITNVLNPAPTVLAFVEGMLEVYNRILYEY